MTNEDLKDYAIDLNSEGFYISIKPVESANYYGYDQAIVITKKPSDRERQNHIIYPPFTIERYKEVQELISILCDRIEDKMLINLKEMQITLDYETISRDLIVKTSEVLEFDDLEDEIFSHTNFIKRIPGKRGSMLQDRCITTITLWFRGNGPIKTRIIKKFNEIR